MNNGIIDAIDNDLLVEIMTLTGLIPAQESIICTVTVIAEGSRTTDQKQI